jgi:hypothetical protein
MRLSTCRRQTGQYEVGSIPTFGREMTGYSSDGLDLLQTRMFMLEGSDRTLARLGRAHLHLCYHDWELWTPKKN